MGIQTCQPVAGHILSRSGNIPTNLNHTDIVTYKSQPHKPESDSESVYVLATSFRHRLEHVPYHFLQRKRDLCDRRIVGEMRVGKSSLPES